MLLFSIYSLIALACILLIYWFMERRKLITLINKIPGPPQELIFGNLKEINCDSVQLWHNLRRLSKEYYPIYKLWSVYVPIVFLVLPEDVEILISSTKHMEKSKVYDALASWLGTGLLTSEGQKWKLRRKLLTPAFHFNILKQFTQIFIHHSDKLIEQLAEECDKSYTEIVPFITKFALNSVCETAMGTQLKSEDKKHKQYRNAINRMGELVIQRINCPWLYNDALYALSTTRRENTKTSKTLHDFSKKVITDRKDQFDYDLIPDDDVNDSNPRKKLAMLDLLISAQKSGFPIDDDGIREEVDTFMFEGHDTTTMSICFTLLSLACHPDIQERVVNEINEVLKNDCDADSSTLFRKMQDLKYLEMVLKESLRMFPSVTFISRYTSETMTTHSGYTIPKGTITNILIYDIHHDPKTYPNPHKFDPDRFLPENCLKRHPFAYIPFSAGPRNCIGQKFAILELKIVLSKILMNYKLIPVDAYDKIEFVTDMIIRSKNGIKIKFEKRIL